MAKVTLNLPELAFEIPAKKISACFHYCFHIFVIHVFNYLHVCVCCVLILALSIRDGGYCGRVAKKQC